MIVFVTVCAARRKKLFARPEAMKLYCEAWDACPEFVVGRYVLMPDHVHLFCCPAHDDQVSLKAWIAKWKAHISRRWPWPDEHPIWQRDFWDRQLRRGENYEQKWEYVRANAVRHGLAREPDEWPYQGEIHVLPWF